MDDIQFENVQFFIDGNMFGCARPDFINPHESICGFGTTKRESYEDLLEMELK